MAIKRICDACGTEGAIWTLMVRDYRDSIGADVGISDLCGDCFEVVGNWANMTFYGKMSVREREEA